MVKNIKGGIMKGATIASLVCVGAGGAMYAEHRYDLIQKAATIFGEQKEAVVEMVVKNPYEATNDLIAKFNDYEGDSRYDKSTALRMIEASMPSDTVDEGALETIAQKEGFNNRYDRLMSAIDQAQRQYAAQKAYSSLSEEDRFKSTYDNVLDLPEMSRENIVRNTFDSLSDDQQKGTLTSLVQKSTYKLQISMKIVKDHLQEKTDGFYDAMKELFNRNEPTAPQQ